MMKKSAYIITKPLQYINATNIPDDSVKDCLLINYFANVDEFHQNVKQFSRNWNQILKFKNRYLALIYVLFRKRKYSKLFVDTDFAIVNRLILYTLYPVKIYVYEEGFGNYRKTIRLNNTIRQKTINFFDSYLGYNHLGGFNRTKGIYLYHPDIFLKLVSPNTKKQVLPFKTGFQQHLTILPEISTLFPTQILQKIKGKDVLIYLTSWEINSKYIEIMQKYPDHIKILKPHPHIKNKTGIEKYFDITITNSLPAEILIAEIANNSNTLIIVHQTSSAMLYFQNIPNFKEYNLSNNNFQNIFETIKSK